MDYKNQATKKFSSEKLKEMKHEALKELLLGNEEKFQKISREIMDTEIPKRPTREVFNYSLKLFHNALFKKIEDSILEIPAVLAAQKIRYSENLNKINNYLNSLEQCLNKIENNIYADTCLSAIEDIKKLLEEL